MASAPATVPWYYHPVTVVVLCIVFFPVGLYLLWRSPRCSITARIIGTAVLALVVVSTMGRDPGSGRSTGQRTSAPAVPSDMVVSPAELVRAYETNEIAADQQYKGKLVRVVDAQVDTIGKDIMGNAYITLRSQHPIRSVQCTLRRSSVQRAASLVPGSIVTVRGEVDGLMMNVLIDDAEILTN